ASRAWPSEKERSKSRRQNRIPRTHSWYRPAETLRGAADPHHVAAGRCAGGCCSSANRGSVVGSSYPRKRIPASPPRPTPVRPRPELPTAPESRRETDVPIPLSALGSAKLRSDPATQDRHLTFPPRPLETQTSNG